jgi:hypothetical protein
MKIAMGFSGQPRMYNEVYPYIKEHILDNYDTDVYVHMWWSEQEAETGMLGAITARTHINISKTAPEDIDRLYNPKQMKVEESLLLKTENFRHDFNEKLRELYPDKNTWNYITLPSAEYWFHHLLSVDRLCQLVDWSQNYDWFLMWRFDARPVCFPNLHKLEKGKLYSFHDNWGTFYDEPYRYNMLSFFLDPELKELLNPLQFYMECADEAGNDIGDMLSDFVPETIRMKHLVASGYKDRLVKLPNHEFNTLLVRP